jgi:hypothetical protein
VTLDLCPTRNLLLLLLLASNTMSHTQSKLVRLGFEQQLEAQEWYALLAIALGTLDLNSPSLASLPKALAASKKMRSSSSR